MASGGLAPAPAAAALSQEEKATAMELHRHPLEPPSSPPAPPPAAGAPAGATGATAATHDNIITASTTSTVAANKDTKIGSTGGSTSGLLGLKPTLGKPNQRNNPRRALPFAMTSDSRIKEQEETEHEESTTTT